MDIINGTTSLGQSGKAASGLRLLYCAFLWTGFLDLSSILSKSKMTESGKLKFYSELILMKSPFSYVSGFAHWSRLAVVGCNY